MSEPELWEHLREQHHHITEGLTDSDVEHWQVRHDAKLHAPTSHVPVPHSHVTEPRLGCELNAHRDLGFCAFCPGRDVYAEVNGWRLLAIEQRGVPKQGGN